VAKFQPLLDPHLLQKVYEMLLSLSHSQLLFAKDLTVFSLNLELRSVFVPAELAADIVKIVTDMAEVLAKFEHFVCLHFALLLMALWAYFALFIVENSFEVENNFGLACNFELG